MFRNSVNIAAIIVSLPALPMAASAGRADTPANQQPQETTIVVTATRTPTPKSQVASSVTVITAKQLEETGQPYVVDALRQVPGLYVNQSGGRGTQANVDIRGGSAGDTLVMIDGVPVNDPSSPDSSYDFANLTVDNIDRIEILRGAQSTLYGSNATAGVINIITRRGHGAPTSHVTVDGGAYRTAEGKLDSSGSARNGWDYSASASQYQTSGFPLAALQPNDTHDDGYRNSTVSARLDKQIGGPFSVGFTGRYIRATDNYTGYGSLNGSTYIALDDGVHRYDSEQIALQGHATFKPDASPWSSTATVMVNTLNRDYLDQPQPQYLSIDYTVGPGNFNGRMYRADWQSSYKASSSNLFTAGLETEQDRAQYDSIADAEALNARTLATNSAYLQDQLTMSPVWFGAVGVRVDDHQQFGNQATYHAGTDYRFPGSGTTLKANYGTGFKAPTLFDLYDPMYGNANLQPEKSQTVDAGVEQAVFHGDGAVSATYFNNRYTNLFSYDPVTFRTINVGKVTAPGVEAAVSYRLGSRLNVNADYTYTRARSDQNPPLDRRPDNLYAASLEYRCSRQWSFNLNGNYVGERYDTDGTAVPVTMPAYTLLNLAAEYQPATRLKLFARLDNLTNTDYQEDYSYRSAGRGLYGGLAFEL